MREAELQPYKSSPLLLRSPTRSEKKSTGGSSSSLKPGFHKNSLKELEMTKLCLSSVCPNQQHQHLLCAATSWMTPAAARFTAQSCRNHRRNPSCAGDLQIDFEPLIGATTALAAA